MGVYIRRTFYGLKNGERMSVSAERVHCPPAISYEIL